MSRFERNQEDVSHGSLLRRLPVALLDAIDLDQVLRLVAHYVMDALAYEDCVIYVTEPDGSLRQRAAWGPKSPNGQEIVNPLVLQFGEGIVGAAAATKQTQMVVDTDLDPRFVTDVAGCRSELAVPIIFENAVLGVIDSEHRETGFFIESDADVIRSIAAMAAARMHSAMSTKKLEATIDELHDTRIILERSVETDALTDIGNRRRFVRNIDAAVASGKRFGVCAIDLDGFKAANDQYGHHQGDGILCCVADALTEVFVGTDAVVARTGGDEFVVLDLPASGNLAPLMQRALRTIERSTAAMFGVARSVTASAGIAYGSDASTWHDADDALFVAKSHGGNQVCLFDPEDTELVQLRSSRSWTERIRRAMTDGGLRLVAQAISSSTDTDADAEIYEVLLRYRDDRGIWVPPGELLEAASRLGLECDIDRWVLKNVVSALVVSPPNLRIAINWSVASLMSPGMTDHLLQQLVEHEVDPTRLVVEVTEHGCIESPEGFRKAVRAFRSAGLSVAIDDLGSGWTSLKMIRDTPVDYIKLDGSWVCNAVEDDLSRVAITSMIDCAHLLDARVIAEWVEDEPTRALLAELGAELLQGWLIHKPVPLEEIVVGMWEASGAVRPAGTPDVDSHLSIFSPVGHFVE